MTTFAFWRRAGLSANEHGHRLGSDAADFLENGLHHAAIAYDGVTRGSRCTNFHRFGCKPTGCREVPLETPAKPSSAATQ